jgi:GPH family glycoside/pentoside/hexuronide:cation symporter
VTERDVASTPSPLPRLDRVRTTTLVRYAIAVAPISMLTSLLYTVLPGMYAKFFGVPLAAVAIITLATRLGDAAIDPLVGYWSDRWRAAGGSRRPFVLAGALTMAVAAWMLAFPPLQYAGAWLGVWSFVLLAGWSVFEIPHAAWGGELARGYDERSRVFGARAAAFYAGGFALFLVPLVASRTTSSFTPATLYIVAAVATGLLLITLPLLYSLPTPPPLTAQSVHAHSVRAVLRSVVRNQPLLGFLVAYAMLSLAMGMYYGLLFLYVDVHLGLTERVAVVFAVASPIGMAATPLWYAAAKRFGKRSAWLYSMAVIAALLCASGFLNPGPMAFVFILVLTLLMYAMFAATAVLAPAILADIADYGRWKFGEDPAGSYYAALTFLAKSVVAAGGSLGLGLAAAFGFDAAGSPSEVAEVGIKLAFAWVPSALVVAALPLIWRLPITPSRLRAIQHRLALRQRFLDATTPDPTRSH